MQTSSSARSKNVRWASVKSFVAGPPGADGPARHDRVAADPTLAVLGGDVLGERDGARLRRAVRRGRSAPSQAVTRRHVDDRPVALLEHVREHRSTAQELAREAGADGPVPGLQTRTEDVAGRTRVDGVGVVVQRVHRAEPLDRRVDQNVDVVLDREVDGLRECRSTRRLRSRRRARRHRPCRGRRRPPRRRASRTAARSLVPCPTRRR